jgi:hypothetical protein
MKHALLIYIFAVSVFSLQGQSLSFDYVDTDGTIVFENLDSINQDVVIKGMVTNETNEDIEVQWRREIKYIYTEGSNKWETAVCDINLCYFPHVGQEDFILPANSSGNLDAHVYPRAVDGDSAIVAIHLLDLNTEDTLLTVEYRFYQDISLSSEQPSSQLETVVFPNPAASYFRVKSDEMISAVEVFDILGKPVAEKQTQSTDVRMNISHLNRGMYFVRIFGQDGRVIRTQRLRKDML